MIKALLDRLARELHSHDKNEAVGDHSAAAAQDALALAIDLIESAFGNGENVLLEDPEQALREVRMITSLLDLPCTLVPFGTKILVRMSKPPYYFEYALPWEGSSVIDLRRKIARMLLSILERWKELKPLELPQPAPLPPAPSPPAKVEPIVAIDDTCPLVSMVIGRICCTSDSDTWPV